LSWTSESVGTSAPTVSVSWAIAEFISSCIFAWSSCESSFDFSAIFSCRRRLFCCTAALAWSDACADSRTIVFRLSTSFSTWISWLAIVSAAVVYCVDFVVSPAFSASGRHDQRLTGVGVELLELGHLGVQPKLALLLVGDDVGRLLLQSAVLVLGLGDRLLQLHLRIGALVERSR
jgi:hypothetical protein